MARRHIEELLPYRQQSPNWNVILRELSAAGVTGAAIAAVCERDTTTIDQWKNHGRRVDYADGATLLALHRKFCGEPK